MPLGRNLEFFNIFSGCEGISENQKKQESRKIFIFKRKKEVCVAIILLAIVLIILCVLKLLNSNISQMPKTKKIRRHLEINGFNESIISKTDIEIVPENRRMNRHSSHRYFEKDFDYVPNVMQISNAKKFLQPLEIHEAELKYDVNRGKTKERNKPPNKLLKDQTFSMRLKGVYVQTKAKEDALKNQLNEKHFYSEEINNLMQNNSDGEGEGRKWPPRTTFKSHGVPFQLPRKERGSFHRQKTLQNNFQSNYISKKHPITIYLDFYPMKEPKIFNKKYSSPTRNQFQNPKSSTSMNVEKFLLPNDNRKGMIIKLNLYPKELTSSKTNIGRRGGNLQSKYNKKVEIGTLGWFPKPKTKRKSKECSIVGVHPHGKHIKGKWKNEHGE